MKNSLHNISIIAVCVVGAILTLSLSTSCQNPTALVVPTFTLTYNANGATSGSIPKDNNAYKQGAIIAVFGNEGSLVKTDFNFAGWSITTDGSGTKYLAGSNITMIAGNITLYAIWIKKSEKAITAFSFTTPAASGVINEAAKTIVITVPYGTSVTGLVATFITTGSSVKVGPSFQASGTTSNNFTNALAYSVFAADGSSVNYTVAVTVTPSSGKSITGFHFAIPEATGIVDESTHTVTITVPFGTNITALSPTITHTGTSIYPDSRTVQNFTNPISYTITAADRSTQAYVATVNVMPVSTYTVIFDSQGGSAITSLSGIDSGSTITAPIAPTKSGFTFDSWNKEIGLTNAWNFATDTVTDNAILYAKWNVVSAATYTVTFDTQGGSNVTNITGLSSGSTTAAPIAPTKSGFTFGSWYKEVGLANLWNFATDTITANTILYAKWVPVTQSILGAYDAWGYTATTGWLKTPNMQLILNANSLQMAGTPLFPFSSTAMQNQNLVISDGQIWMTYTMSGGPGVQTIYLLDYFLEDATRFKTPILWVTSESTANKTLTSAPSNPQMPMQGISPIIAYVLVGNAPGNVDLSALTVSSGTLTPAFNAATTSYTVEVPNSVNTIKVSGTKADAGANLAISPIQPMNLSLGINKANLVVSASSGATKTYTVNITRATSTNADLSSLTVSIGSLSPAFAASTTAYTVSVPYTVTSVTVTGAKADGNANASLPVTLNNLLVGVAQTATISVTAQSGTTKTYNVAVTRAPASTNADMNSLTANTGTLSPAFTASTTAYTASVANTVSSITVTGTKADSYASISAPITLNNLAWGVPQTATITVTAQSGTTKVYTVVVTREAASTNADLSTLVVSSGTLSPTFVATITTYTVNVPNSESDILVTATTMNSNATVSISPTLTSLVVGANTFTALVTAQSGAKKAYTITVIRDPSANADLSALAVSSGTLTPVFNTASTAYTMNLPGPTATISLAATKAEPNAVVQIDPIQPSILVVGANTITITVTAQSGVIKTYTIIVTVSPTDYISTNIGTLKGIPGGTYQRDESVSNTSTVQAFRMSEKEITRTQFISVTGMADPSITYLSSGKTDPVQSVNWYQALIFCNKLSMLEGLLPAYTINGSTDPAVWIAANGGYIPGTTNIAWDSAVANWTASGYRLPTEMEWMWAAMGAKDGLIGFKKDFSGDWDLSRAGTSPAGYAWYSENSAYKTHPVGIKYHNELGLYDMSGNVSEWCWDWYAPSPDGALTSDSVSGKGPVSGSARVIRGGSWFGEAIYLHICYRNYFYRNPYQVKSDLGFRVVRP